MIMHPGSGFRPPREAASHMPFPAHPFHEAGVACSQDPAIFHSLPPPPQPHRAQGLAPGPLMNPAVVYIFKN